MATTKETLTQTFRKAEQEGMEDAKAGGKRLRSRSVGAKMGGEGSSVNVRDKRKDGGENKDLEKSGSSSGSGEERKPKKGSTSSGEDSSRSSTFENVDPEKDERHADRKESGGK